MAWLGHLSVSAKYFFYTSSLCSLVFAEYKGKSGYPFLRIDMIMQVSAVFFSGLAGW